MRWLSIFGPGAIVASLTIGAGELIFSARAGALFGFDILWFFGLVLFAKWVLLYTLARQMVLSGTHPIGAWANLPGARGWLPLAMFALAVVCFPIWVCFHAGTVGTLAASLAGPGSVAANHHLYWGGGILAAVLVLSLAGGYSLLEKAQLGILCAMLAAIVLVVLLLRPDWAGLAKGLFLPGTLRYPDWAGGIEELRNRSVWLEAITYVGVLGGSSYDYLAYVSYLREKRWGRAAGDAGPIDSRWLRAPLIDCTASFVAVLLFTLVFVVCGKMLLAPRETIPAGTNLLQLQAAFVTPLGPQLQYLYFAGAFLAILGTLYGTIEVFPTLVRETLTAFQVRVEHAALRRMSVLWAGGGALLLLGALLSFTSNASLIRILTPANLFTGVLGCGIILLLNPWVERTLPPDQRMPTLLRILNLAAGVCFFALGLKGYWDHSRWFSFAILLGTVALGVAAARVWKGRSPVR